MGTMHPLVKAQNDGSSANSREIPVLHLQEEKIWERMSMWDVLNVPEILPQRFNPEFGAAREWKNNAFASVVYMIQYRGYDSNVDTDDILSLLADWDSEYCMDTPSTFHMRGSYVLKTQSHDHDTPTYMEALSGENSEE